MSRAPLVFFPAFTFHPLLPFFSTPKKKKNGRSPQLSAAPLESLGTVPNTEFCCPFRRSRILLRSLFNLDPFNNRTGYSSSYYTANYKRINQAGAEHPATDTVDNIAVSHCADVGHTGCCRLPRPAGLRPMSVGGAPGGGAGATRDWLPFSRVSTANSATWPSAAPPLPRAHPRPAPAPAMSSSRSPPRLASGSSAARSGVDMSWPRSDSARSAMAPARERALSRSLLRSRNTWSPARAMTSCR